MQYKQDGNLFTKVKTLTIGHWMNFNKLSFYLVSESICVTSEPIPG